MKKCIWITLCLALALLLTGCGEKKDAAGECRLMVRCDTIMERLDELDETKRAFVPEDGVVLDSGTVGFADGETAFDLLKREVVSRNMQYEFTKTPVTGGVYIEGINNLYEFDLGELSGWQFAVNGKFDSVDCGSYVLQDGDTVEFLYTCDLGKDIGGGIYE